MSSWLISEKKNFVVNTSLNLKKDICSLLCYCWWDRVKYFLGKKEIHGKTDRTGSFFVAMCYLSESIDGQRIFLSYIELLVFSKIIKWHSVFLISSF